MLSSLDWEKVAANIPEGLDRGADPSALTTGTLMGLDAENGLVQVSTSGSEGVWVPAVAGIYPQSSQVRLMRAPLEGGRISMCLGPLTPGPTLVGGRVVSVNAPVGLLTVSTMGANYALPYAPGTYSAGTLVHVIRSAPRYGLPEYVLGPSGNYNAENPGQPGGGTSNPGQLVDKQAIILPEWSGSWRAQYSRWDSWNTDRYGGRSSLWQGNGFGSGQMTGLATYGDRISALGAAAITNILVSVYRADSSSTAAKVAVLQPTTEGGRPAGAPAIPPSASVATPPLGVNGGAQVALPGSVLDGFRTGAFKGLVTVGGDYAAFSGTPDRAPVHADGMALVVQYQVRQ